MAKRMGLTGKISIIVVAIVFVSISILTLISYRTIFDSVERAAGIELTGCANITIGLLKPDEVKALVKGDTSLTDKVSQTISWTTKQKPIFENQYILSLDGKILVPDQNLKKQGFNAGDDFYIDKDAINNLLALRTKTFSHIYKYGGMERITGYAPIFEDNDESKDIIAINAIDFETSIIKERTLEMMWKNILFGILLPLISGLITFIIVRKMMSPMVKIIQYAKQIANGDLTAQPLDVKSKDELGQLAKGFNTMIANLKTIIEKVLTNSEQVASTAGQVSVSVEEINKATDHIAVSVQSIAQGSFEQVNSSNEVNFISKGISTEMDQIVYKVSSVTESSNTASTIAINGNDAIVKAINQMGIIGKQSSYMEEAINSLNKKSQEIGKIISLITDVTDQTNLLALNAAIEAARAGQQGKGFAVVAAEVRKLAEQSGNAATQISKLIKEIQNETNRVVATMDNSEQMVTSGIGMVENAGKSFNEIATSIEKVTSQIQDVSLAVTNINTGIQRMSKKHEEITNISNSSAEMTQQIAGTTEEQTASMQEISAATNLLAKMAIELKDAVAFFKVSSK